MAHPSTPIPMPYESINKEPVAKPSLVEPKGTPVKKNKKNAKKNTKNKEELSQSLVFAHFLTYCVTWMSGEVRQYWQMVRIRCKPIELVTRDVVRGGVGGVSSPHSSLVDISTNFIGDPAMEKKK